MQIRRSLLIILLLLPLFLISCKRGLISKQYEPAEDGSITVACTSAMICEVLAEIGKNFITVQYTPWVFSNPHHYKPTDLDILMLLKSNYIFYNGGTFEGRLEWALERLDDRLSYISISNLIEEKDILYYANVRNKGKQIINPHFWLDPVLWKNVVQKITSKLVSIDNKSEIFYYNNEDEYIYKLQALDKYIADKVKDIPRSDRIILTEHNSFAYFGKRYDFDTISFQDMPSVYNLPIQKVAIVAELIKRRGIKVVFTEYMFSDKHIKLLQTYLAASGYEVRHGGTLYTDIFPTDKSYISIMKENIDTIYNALKKDN